MRNYHFFKVFMVFLFSSSRKTYLMEGEGEKEEEKNTVKCKRRERERERGGEGGEETYWFSSKKGRSEFNGCHRIIHIRIGHIPLSSLPLWPEHWSPLLFVQCPLPITMN